MVSGSSLIRNGEDPGERMANYSVILPRRIPHGQVSLVGYSPWGLVIRHD